MFRLVTRQVVRQKRNTPRMQPVLEGLEHRVVLSTFKVNTVLDTVAVNLHNGKDSTGHISLRSAIQAADAKSGSDTIIVPSGTFTLTIPGQGEDASATGDLDITGNLTIKGKSSAKTIIDGNNLDRVFQILSGKVSISNVTIERGRVNSDGGGILNSGGKVTLSSVVIENNVAAGVNGIAGANGFVRGRSEHREEMEPSVRTAEAAGFSMRADRSRSRRARSSETWQSAAMVVPAERVTWVSAQTVGQVPTGRMQSAERAAPEAQAARV